VSQKANYLKLLHEEGQYSVISQTWRHWVWKFWKLACRRNEFCHTLINIHENVPWRKKANTKHRY